MVKKVFPFYTIASTLAIIGLAVLLSSCKQSSGSGIINATGRPGEIMVVMDNQYRDSKLGAEIENVLQSDVPSLPQSEPMFSLSWSTIKGFTGFLTYVRNILYIDIDQDRFTKTSSKYTYDVWAKGQMVVKITSPSPDSVVNFFETKGYSLNNLFLRHEMYRYDDYLVREYSKVANHLVDSLFDHHINVPEDIRKWKSGKNFLWMSNDHMRQRHDLLVYTYPYHSNQDIGLDRMIQVRDSVLKVNIEGGYEGSYPETEKLVNTQFHRYIFGPNKGEVRGELRGLWKMTGGQMMGGPFVCQAYVDKKAGLVYMVEGFVYNPNEDKRNLIRMMEAALYTFRPSSEKVFDPNVIKKLTYSTTY